MVGMTPRCSWPDSGSRDACARSIRFSAPSKRPRDRSATLRPSAVGTTDRLVRSSSGAPNSSSSSWMLALSVDWLTLQAAAACPKWQRSTTATR